MSYKEEIKNIIQEMKRDRPDEFFMGRCKKNSEELCDKIEKNLGLETSLCIGGVDYPEEPSPKNIEQCKKDGIIHRWVEVETSRGVIIADVSCEINGEYGDIYIGEELPKEYTKMKEI